MCVFVFIQLFSQCLFSSYYVLGNVVGFGNVIVNKSNKDFFLNFSQQRLIINKCFYSSDKDNGDKEIRKGGQRGLVGLLFKLRWLDLRVFGEIVVWIEGVGRVEVL